MTVSETEVTHDTEALRGFEYGKREALTVCEALPCNLSKKGHQDSL